MTDQRFMMPFATLVPGRLFGLITCALFAVVATTVVGQEFKFLEVTVFDENGKPMVDVPVEINMDGLEFPMNTDRLGMISLNVAAGRNPVELKVRQPGYELRRVRWRRGSEVPPEYTMKMQLGKPSQGWVFDAKGAPVAGAEVFAAPPDAMLTFVNGRNPPNSKQTAVTTDEQGKFTLPFQPEGSTIVCVSDAGWAQFMKSKDENGDRRLEIDLTPWVQVELLTRIRDQAPGGDTVGLQFVRGIAKSRGKAEWHYHGITNEQGSFACDRAIPGTAIAYRMVPLKLAQGQPEVDNRSHGVVSQLTPGAKVQILIGGAKQQATGKLFKSVSYDGQVDWESGYVVLTENNPVDLALRTAIFEYGKLLSQSNVYRPEQRIPPSGLPNYLIRYLAAVQPDGSFQIDNIPPGQYKLTAIVTAQPKDEPTKTDLLSLAELPFTIMSGEVSFDLGEHILDHTGSFAKPIMK